MPAYGQQEGAELQRGTGAGDTGEDTYMTVSPSGTGRPLASNLNVVAGQTLPNLVIARVGLDGRVSIYSPTSRGGSSPTGPDRSPKRPPGGPTTLEGLFRRVQESL